MTDNKPDYILIHCSAYPASSADRLKDINGEHEVRGFDKSSLGYYVGYHVLLTGGKKYRTRVDLEHGDHCNDVNFRNKAGFLFPDHQSLNFHALAICVDFNGDQGPMPGWALPMLKEQVQEWMMLYGIPLERVRFHREFSGVKTCPGATITRGFIEDLLALPAPPVPAPVATPEVLRKQITLLQTLLVLLQELLHLKQKQGLGSTSSMEEITLPAWYQSSAGPGISRTLIANVGTFIPVLNFVLQSKGIHILPETVDFWITFVVFIGFAVMNVVGYVRAKLVLGRQVAALKGQVRAMGASPVI